MYNSKLNNGCTYVFDVQRVSEFDILVVNFIIKRIPCYGQVNSLDRIRYLERLRVHFGEPVEFNKNGFFSF